MRLLLIGLAMMAAGISILFTIVIGVIDSNLPAALFGYSLVIAGLVSGGVGAASIFRR